MKIEEIRRIAVIGAGFMGSQIAEILSRQFVCNVNIMDINEELVKKGIRDIEQRVENFFVSKGKLTAEDKERILARIKGVMSIADAVKEADFVIEAVAERLDLKKQIFKQLDENAPSHTILASNTSFQNISEVGSVTRRPEHVVGTHFFTPVSVMKLVEVVKGACTSDKTVRLACDLARKLGKEPILCRDTSYGFLANRAYTAMMNEAIQMVWERIAPPVEIDKAVKLGYNLPIGPLELMDYAGSWQIFVASEKDRMRELGPEKGSLHPLVRMMDRAGYNNVYDFWKDILSKW